MDRLLTAGAVFALGFLGGQSAGFDELRFGEPVLSFKEESVVPEYTPAKDEAVAVVRAETEEGLENVEIRDPGGAPVVRLWTPRGHEHALQGFIVETRESPLAELVSTYAEGVYDLHARAEDGRLMVGSAVFSHELVPAPVVVHPVQGQVNVPTHLTVRWVPHPAASGYRVILEQNENDGLSVELPAGSSSFQVPEGILAPGTPTLVEVGALAPGGNSTLVEVSFTTL